MKILFISTLLPCPQDNGGKIKTFHTLKVLSKNHTIDFISFINNKDEQQFIDQISEYCSNISLVEKILIKSHSKKIFLMSFIKSLFSKYPYVVNKFYSRKMKNKITKLQENNMYDVIYVDHLQMMRYKKLFDFPVILDQHNVESLIVKRHIQKEKSIVKKIFLYLEYIKLYRFEKKTINELDYIIALSDRDKNELQNMRNNNYIKKEIETIPICIETDLIKYNYHVNSKKINLLFIGTMSWFPNSQGIQWFVKNVFSQLDKEKFHLFIVGGNPTNEIIQLNQISNITVTGYVKDVNEYFSFCDLLIVPLFIGSGLRVKILEAFAKGMPVISTQIGAEGLAFKERENILIANNQDEFLEVFKEIYEDMGILKSIALKGRETYLNKYSLLALEKDLNKFISTVIKSG
ncbi:glycosyltransferase [Fictibacillus barbaricus]|uniref:Glycosyltransferase involved in cell wall biosynthesis n=1 Tax=Fictibacillus barbaricus TaxID=182136 RepID=A0ABU1U1M4_9BACL|nr:glycosyltransferase [Fictibacillus barbaricus]MDR7073325.1 glycosyltransferase involved in cell wall biosynthesis [Fictibacillus barbaricus]